jgi:hypothetical protein
MSQASNKFNIRVDIGKLWFQDGRGSVVPLNVIPAPPDSTQRAVSVLHNTEEWTKVGSMKVVSLIRLFRFSECFSFCPPGEQSSDGAPTTIMMERDGKNPKKRSETR